MVFTREEEEDTLDCVFQIFEVFFYYLLVPKMSTFVK